MSKRTEDRVGKWLLEVGEEKFRNFNGRVGIGEEVSEDFRRHRDSNVDEVLDALQGLLHIVNVTGNRLTVGVDRVRLEPFLQEVAKERRAWVG